MSDTDNIFDESKDYFDCELDNKHTTLLPIVRLLKNRASQPSTPKKQKKDYAAYCEALKNDGAQLNTPQNFESMKS